MTQARQAVVANWDEEDEITAAKTPQIDAERHAALVASWDEEDETPAPTHKKEILYTQAELDARVAAATKQRSGPAGNALLLKDFDLGMQITALADKYGISTAAVRSRIRMSGRSIRKCPHCGGGL